MKSKYKSKSAETIELLPEEQKLKDREDFNQEVTNMVPV